MSIGRKWRMVAAIVVINLLITYSVIVNLRPVAASPAAAGSQPHSLITATVIVDTPVPTGTWMPTSTYVPATNTYVPPTSTNIPATETWIATATVTLPPFPTNTPQASVTPVRTATAQPSNTPQPSSTTTWTPTYTWTPYPSSTWTPPPTATRTPTRVPSITPTSTPTTTCTLRGPDTDGDALPDDWEINGVPQRDGSRYNIKQMGADPCHKDIFIEGDYMVGGGYNHKAKNAAMAIDIRAFNTAPVANPDNTTGIHLHMDSGPDSVMNPVTGQLWGNLSRANRVPYRYRIGYFVGQNYNWTDFDNIKRVNFTKARQCVFHYGLWVHYYDHTTSSGYSRGIGAADYIVSLGAFAGGVGSVNQQAGTNMHELGHNLGLTHGGSDHVNYKPNYLSIMNYFFQMNGLIKNGRDGSVFDYSRWNNPALNENALNENVGLNGGAPLNPYGTRWWVGAVQRMTIAVNNWIDWNGNGVRNNPAVADINGDGGRGVLATQDNWANIVYNGGGLLGATCNPNMVQPAMADDQDLLDPELDPAMDAQISKEYTVSVTGLADHETAAGSSYTANVSVTNSGSNSDSYTLAGNSTLGWADFSSLPTSVTLAAGQSATYAITVNVPSDATNAAVDEISVSATSQGDPDLSDVSVANSSVTPECANNFVDVGGNIFYTAIHTLNCAGAINGSDPTHYSPAGNATRAQFAKIVTLSFALPSYIPDTPSFSDVPTSYFAYAYIETGYANGILSGYDQATCDAIGAAYPCYGPNRLITRAQLTKLVVNAAGYEQITPPQPSFSDVPTSNIFYSVIETAHAHSVINGYSDNTFRPNNNIRRDEMAQIVYKGVTTP